MSKQINIFATRDDLIPMLKTIEAVKPLKYALCGIFDTPITFYNSLLNYPLLGFNTTGEHVAENFLVCDVSTKINIKKIVDSNGKTLYSLYPIDNDQSIVFSPGGIFNGKYLVCGHIGTTFRNEESLTLFKIFSKTLIKNFKKVKGYYVGSEAEVMLDKGARLVTISISSPEIYDLKR